MDEFELPVIYKGKEILFNSSLQVTGYTHRFIVDIFGQSVIFEPDEERNYRAIVSTEDLNNNKNIDQELLKMISEKITEIVG
ncbi:MAG: hypothetical protein M3R50_08270 [Bacteroidota bacterium]|nr:hypothetical protein [Bacteroidota bacterium]